MLSTYCSTEVDKKFSLLPKVFLHNKQVDSTIGPQSSTSCYVLAANIHNVSSWKPDISKRSEKWVKL